VTGTAWVPGLAVGAAVVFAAGRSGRRWRGAPLAVAGHGYAGSDRRDLAATLHAVAAQLRAGAAPPVAWSHVLGARPGAVADLEPLLLERCGGARPARRGGSGGARAAPGPGGNRAGSRGRGPGAPERARVRAAVAAVAVADELGAPLAPVLERIAGAVALDEEAAADLDAALAGPHATARLLAWLPALGVVLGTALGSDPVAVLLGGGIGTWAGWGGVAFTVAGRAWTRRLVRAAAAGAQA
jgi:tight adherence protein B